MSISTSVNPEASLARADRIRLVANAIEAVPTIAPATPQPMATAIPEDECFISYDEKNDVQLKLRYGIGNCFYVIKILLSLILQWCSILKKEPFIKFLRG